MENKNTTFTNDEQKAINHECTMTQKLFDSIMDKYEKIEMDDTFYQLLREYPIFLSEYANRITEDIDFTNELLTDEIDKRIWNNILEKINN